MSARTLWLTLALTASGCASNDPNVMMLTCVDDSECGSGLVCFPEQGCVDPSTNVVVEVTSRGANQDVVSEDVALGSVAPVLTLVLPGASQVGGVIERATGTPGNPGTPLPYTGEVRIQATGESVLIPGVLRQYERTFTDLEAKRGQYAIGIGSGAYVVTATASTDSSIPMSSVPFNNGQPSRLDFLFPSHDGTLVLAGRLLHRIVPGSPPTEVPIKEAAMVVQAIDPVTSRPLSQPTTVSSGFEGSQGDFTLSIDPAAGGLSSLVVVATPKETGAPVPSKSFTLHPPFLSPLLLELGDYGPLRKWSQRLKVGPSYVAGARVYVEGEVEGGGVFRSRSVTSDSNGRFEVEAPASAAGTSYSLVAVPPSNSRTASLRAEAKTVARPDGGFTLEHAGSSTCADQGPDFCMLERVRVTGTVEFADGNSAHGVKVTAVPLEALDGGVLPVLAVEAASDDNARFELFVDPARYRFEFQPLEDLPARTRIETITRQPLVDGTGVKTFDLQSVRLFNGRKVVGTVAIEGGQQLVPEVPAANARVRFFRVSGTGKNAATLLGETVADQQGQFTVVLPGP